MRPLLPWLLGSGLLLVLGLLAWLVLAFQAGRPADAEAARELREALGTWAEVVLYKGLAPQLVLTLLLYGPAERVLGGRERGRIGVALVLFGCAAVAAIVLAGTLMRTEAFGLPAVAYTGPGNFLATVLQMSAAVTAAALLARELRRKAR